MSKCEYTVNDAGIATMIINNPPMNALSTEVLKDVNDCVFKVLSDEKVRVIVFTGAGKAFIAGADIKEVESLNEAVSAADYLIYGQDICNKIENADKPFIAAINGFCLGGGLEFALACHIRIADEKSQMGLPEIKLGIIPGYGGTQRTPRFIGKARALELILSGNFIDGKTASEYGLVNRTAPAGESLNEALKLAGAIARKGRPAIKAAMRAVNEGILMELSDSLKFERELFGRLAETENKKEGVAAFLQKREPGAIDN